MSEFCGAYIDEGSWVEERNRSEEPITPHGIGKDLLDALEYEGVRQDQGLHADKAVEQVLEVGFAICCLSIVPPIFFEAIATKSLYEPWIFKEVYIIHRQPTIRRQYSDRTLGRMKVHSLWTKRGFPLSGVMLVNFGRL